MDDFFSTDDESPRARLALLAGGRTEAPVARDGVDELDPQDGPVVDYSDPERAIEVLHREYSARLFAYALSMLRNREDAEDAVQTTFLNAYNSLVDGRMPRQQTSWLFRIVRNVCLNRIRTHTRKPASTLEGIDIATSKSVEDQLDQHLHAVALRSALERLPEQQRKAIVLRELQGASYAEIATALDTTQGAVESLIFRARRQLASSIRTSASGMNSGLARAAA
ncbi:MAG: polymerase, sigma-24 subunit, subfamily [Thermoleophilia bacterium]|nr:polymerase, sigma-24 subunit, subfamily [Thermoleophilia bacterium]